MIPRNKMRRLDWLIDKRAKLWVKVKVLVTQLCLTLCDPMGCSPPGCSLHGIFQARILEWVAIPPSTQQQLMGCLLQVAINYFIVREAP